MPTLHPGDPLFPPHLESVLLALGAVRETRPNLDLIAYCRFDGPRTSYFISDIGRDGRPYGVQLTDGERPHVGYFELAELNMLKRIGRLYRGDLLDSQATIAAIARIAHERLNSHLDIEV